MTKPPPKPDKPIDNEPHPKPPVPLKPIQPTPGPNPKGKQI